MSEGVAELALDTAVRGGGAVSAIGCSQRRPRVRLLVFGIACPWGRARQVQLRGRGSQYSEPQTGQELQEPMPLGRERARSHVGNIFVMWDSGRPINTSSLQILVAPSGR